MMHEVRESVCAEMVTCAIRILSFYFSTVLLVAFLVHLHILVFWEEGDIKSGKYLCLQMSYKPSRQATDHTEERRYLLGTYPVL